MDHTQDAGNNEKKNLDRKKENSESSAESSSEKNDNDIIPLDSSRVDDNDDNKGANKDVNKLELMRSLAKQLENQRKDLNRAVEEEYESHGTIEGLRVREAMERFNETEARFIKEFQRRNEEENKSTDSEKNNKDAHPITDLDD